MVAEALKQVQGDGRRWRADREISGSLFNQNQSVARNSFQGFCLTAWDREWLFEGINQPWRRRRSRQKP
jgi:hypothetical protein